MNNFPKPLHNEVIVKRDDKNEELDSGLVIVRAHERNVLFGTVMSVGSEVTEMKSGDRVVFPKFSGKDITYEDVKYIIFKDTQIFGVLEND